MFNFNGRKRLTGEQADRLKGLKAKRLEGLKADSRLYRHNSLRLRNGEAAQTLCLEYLSQYCKTVD